MSIEEKETRRVAANRLAKLEIEREVAKVEGRFTKVLSALFNPNQLQYRRDVQWKVEAAVGRPGEPPRCEFTDTAPQTLTLELFFDTYEGDPPGERGFLEQVGSGMENLVGGYGLSSMPSARDVVRYTGKVASLAQVDGELGRPPLCQLWWGRWLLLTGVLTSLGEQYTFFTEDGTPVRASLNCTFKRVIPSRIPSNEQLPEAAGVDGVYIVQPGDTLLSIATSRYGDPAAWRIIARKNAIVEPRKLEPGTRLSIPKIGR